MKFRIFHQDHHHQRHQHQQRQHQRQTHRENRIYQILKNSRMLRQQENEVVVHIANVKTTKIYTAIAVISV